MSHSGLGGRGGRPGRGGSNAESSPAVPVLVLPVLGTGVEAVAFPVLLPLALAFEVLGLGTVELGG